MSLTPRNLIAVQIRRSELSPIGRERQRACFFRTDHLADYLATDLCSRFSRPQRASTPHPGRGTERVAVVSVAPVTQAPSRKPMPASGVHRTVSLGRFVRISQAPRRNPMHYINIRRIVKLCRLPRRPDVTLFSFRRYDKTSGFADYSGAQIEVVDLYGVIAFFRRSDYSGAQTELKSRSKDTAERPIFYLGSLSSLAVRLRDSVDHLSVVRLYGFERAGWNG
jgi:hypothetical protein